MMLTHIVWPLLYWLGCKSLLLVSGYNSRCKFILIKIGIGLTHHCAMLSLEIRPDRLKIVLLLLRHFLIGDHENDRGLCFYSDSSLIWSGDCSERKNTN
jgi:hypothetical protein